MTTALDIEKVLLKKLMSSVSKKIDLEKLAAKMAPEFERKLRKEMLTAVRSFTLADILYDSLGKDFYKGLSVVGSFE